MGGRDAEAGSLRKGGVLNMIRDTGETYVKKLKEGGNSYVGI